MSLLVLVRNINMLISAGSADIKEILQRDDVQLVSLVTPPNTHCELVLLALKVRL